MLKPLLRLSFVFTLLLLTYFPSIGQKQNSIYDQLVFVNATWKNQKDVNPSLKDQAASPLTEQEIVRQHLQETELLLRSRKITSLTAQQQANRLRNLDVLHSYWQAGIFPKNTHHSNRQPYFIDDYNNYCAVGYLMKESGANAMARAIHESQNFSYLANIQHPDLINWAKNSGLSLDELALIQPGYGGEWQATVIEMHYNNTGQDVNEYIEFHQSNGGLIGMYPFTSIQFYNFQGSLYKTLTVNDLQPINGLNSFFSYQFPAGESFADSGKIVLTSSFTYPANGIVQVITYNSSGIRQEDFTGFAPPSPYVRQFSAAESEATPVGSSITFCGLMQTNWNATVQAATAGTVNPCTLGALPITLLSFDCQLQKNTVLVNWQTASETNNSYFEVERSTNGVDFTAIGKITGAGNSSGVKSYSFVDSKPNYANYYRLKQIDKDGKFSYSQIQFIKFASGSALTLLQNPVSGILKFRINSSEVDAGQVIIYDFTGRTVKEATAKAGFNEMIVGHLAAGKYMLRLFGKNRSMYTQPFIIQ
jgi:hypothetical protein